MGLRSALCVFLGAAAVWGAGATCGYQLAAPLETGSKERNLTSLWGQSEFEGTEPHVLVGSIRVRRNGTSRPCGVNLSSKEGNLTSLWGRSEFTPTTPPELGSKRGERFPSWSSGIFSIHFSIHVENRFQHRGKFTSARGRT